MRRKKNSIVELATSSFHSIVSGIRSQYPYLDDVDAQVMANEYMNEIGRRLSIGEKPAFVTQNEYGEFILTYLGLEQDDEQEEDQ